MARITGIGGIFFKTRDPKALSAWYRDVLGIKVEPWGGAMLPVDAPGHPGFTLWSPFPQNSDYFAPSPQPFMINFAVDDLAAFLTELEGKGVTILDRKDEDHGRFAWLLDPDGNKIELWQPAE